MLRRRAALAAAILGTCLALPGVGLAQRNDPSFRLVNNTGETVAEVYASPTTDQNWGHDRLGTEVIRPGANHIVRLPVTGECTYDLRIVYQGGQAEERRGVDLCATVNFVLGGGGAGQPGTAQGQARGQGAAQGPATGAPQGNPSFNLLNQSQRVVERVFASPSTEDNWGPDRLGNDLVPPGQRYPIRLPAGECTYDIRVVFRDGAAQEERRLDACGIVDFVVR